MDYSILTFPKNSDIIFIERKKERGKNMKCIYMSKAGKTYLYCYGGDQAMCDKMNRAKQNYFPEGNLPEVWAGWHYYMAEQPMFDTRDL